MAHLIILEKLFLGILDHVWLKLAFSATDTSYHLETYDVASTVYVADNNDTDQTAQMRSLISAFADRQIA